MLHSFFKGMTGRVTTRLVVVVAASILITAVLGYVKLFQVTETNSSIRIDRAARAATALFVETLSAEFTVLNNSNGTPMAIRLKQDAIGKSLTFRPRHDALLKQIGLINQGAANLFKFNLQTKAFDRFATTFRKPDGSMPPPMSIKPGHPAYDDIFNNRPHLGEVPVMGRLRLAYLTPIQTASGGIAGALAVDVGWVDDLIAARNELRVQIAIAALVMILLVAAFGAMNMSRELKPLRVLARHADELAAEATDVEIPFKDRRDEIGALSQGLDRVVALQGKLVRLAYTDELTGLGNRTRYLANLQTALGNDNLGQRRPVLIHLDLDNFKQINDAFGQRSGDTLLELVGNRFTDVLGSKPSIARLAADEFAILLPHVDSMAHMTKLADGLLASLREPVVLDVGELHLTASIGIINLRHDARNSDEAHRNADLALRKAKENGGDQYVFFSSELNDALQDQMRLDRMLRTALEEREIEIHFQPQVMPGTHELAGVEALARWIHPTEGPIPPSKFIPIAESSGQIVELGSLVLDLACEQAAKWRKTKFDFKHISVNVSPIQLWQPDFVGIIKAALHHHQVAGRDIYIEITESVFVDHSEHRIAAILSAIRALGVKLSLDDFGSGYSSLGYLNRLPFDQLKVDRSFVSDIDTDQRKQQVLRGVLELGRGLGFNIVVEGTETLAEVKVVETIGCDSIQGFYFARPAPALMIPDLVRKISTLGPSRQIRSA
ncbi:MAG: EAL domain-containing protein [Rhizobiaceae bacterium]